MDRRSGGRMLLDLPRRSGYYFILYVNRPARLTELSRSFGTPERRYARCGRRVVSVSWRVKKRPGIAVNDKPSSATTSRTTEPRAPTAVDHAGRTSVRSEARPDDPRFRKEFEAFQLRLGPGDWAGTTIKLIRPGVMGRASTCGDGPAERRPSGPRSFTTTRDTILSFM